MHIAFNATPLLSPLTGIGQYSRQLALGLAGSPDIEAEFFYGAIWSPEVYADLSPGRASILPWLRSHLPYSYPLRRFIQEQRFTRYANRQRFDLYHEPNILPLPFDGPTVVTVHDLSWIRYPQAHPMERVRAMDKYFEAGIQHASLVLTDSVFIKRELVEVFSLPPERIQPVLLGVESLFQPRDAIQTTPILAQHGLRHGQYILAVGTLEPRKNLQVALRAFSKLPAQLRRNCPLVLVGLKGWHTSDLERQLGPLVQAGEIRLLGYLSREDLARVIAGATALVYPSIYEGFGLPPLEAMACGVPVIVSNVSSLPEVVGDTGLMMSPEDVDGLARHMELLICAPEVRQSLASKALQRSAGFTWARCVEQTIDAYRQVLSKSR